MAKKIITKEQIFETGVRLAQSMPPGSLTVAAVCAEMGVVKSTFYRHYRSLKDLFYGIMNQAFDEVMLAIPKILLEEKTNVEKIEELWNVATARLVANGPQVMGYIILYGEGEVDERHFYLKDPFVTTVKTLIRHAQMEKEIPDVNDSDVLFSIINMYFIGMNSSWSKMNGAFDYHAMLSLGIRGILGASISMEQKQIIPNYDMIAGKIY